MSTEDQKTLLATALKRFKRVADAEAEGRERALKCFRFEAGEQWPQEIAKAREGQKRPCLTINKTSAFVRQVTNDQRQNRPQIRVIPADDRADVETAKVLNGLIRHIQVASAADAAYDKSVESAAIGARGYFRVVADYPHDGTFEQEIFIKRVANPFTVYLDPSATEADRSDARWGFVVEDMDLETYKEIYDDNPIEWGESGVGDRKGWLTPDTVRVAEYFYLVDELVTYYQLANGSVVTELPAGQKPLQERKARKTRCMWCKLSAGKILEEVTEFPASYIPIFAVLGDERSFDGKVKLRGMVEDLIEPAQVYNFQMTSFVEGLGLTVKPKWMMAEGQAEGYENEWRNANVSTDAALTYKPQTLAGQVLPPPQRIQPEGPPAGILAAMQVASDDLKAVSGIYDASLGRQSNETSGRAILARESQSKTANFHFEDNLARALKFAGKVIVQMIPRIYDTARVVRILGIDNEPEMVAINQQTQRADGSQGIYDLRVGRYDVVVEVGPSYATRRQESAAAMVDLAKADPSLMQKAPDLVVKAFDWPGAAELSERLKLFLPPEVQAALQKNAEGPQLPPEIAAQMGQMQMQAQGLQQQLQQAMMSAQRAGQEAQQVQLRAAQKALSDAERIMGLQQQLAAAKQETDAVQVEAKVERMCADAVAEIKSLVAQCEALQPQGSEVVDQAEQNPNLVLLTEVQGVLAGAAQQAIGLLSAPKEVVRDPATGLIVGIRTAVQSGAMHSPMDEVGLVE